ncbi:MAG: trehalose-phosphatase [Nocardioidaceae bacterium]
MTSNDVVTARGADTLDAVLRDPAGTVLALDFDGTLAPITHDPESARAHPGSIMALERLGVRLARIAVVTGRPVATAVRLGGFEALAGLDSMVVMGQYGVERWDAATRETYSPPPPPGIVGIDAELPGLLAGLGLGEARVEHKGRAVVVHTRGLAQPDSALDRLRGPLAALADRNEMVVEPGKQVLEIREPGTDKGDAIRVLVDEAAARQVIFAGDDLGDLPAFDAVDELHAAGIKGLLVCSSSEEQDALVARADVVVHGPDAVAEWLTWLADELDRRDDG